MKPTQITNEKALNDYIDHVRRSFEKHRSVTVSCTTSRRRTLSQNAALHKYCTMLAETFNDAGLDMQAVLSEGTSIPWSAEKVKDDIWRKVQIALTGKKSSTELDRTEVSKVYDVVNRHLSQTFGIFVPFPSQDHD